MTNTSRLAVLLVVCLMTLVCASKANAQASYGVRAGVSADPDQFVVGAHLETKPLLEHLTFRPNFEAGFGDNATVLAFNFEFAYRIDLNKKPWWIYIGAGPAAIYAHEDNAGSDFGGGFNILVGVQHRKGLFAEVKFGMIDSPDFKFMVGYAFKKK